jgi:hypothetical protein
VLFTQATYFPNAFFVVSLMSLVFLIYCNYKHLKSITHHIAVGRKITVPTKSLTPPFRFKLRCLGLKHLGFTVINVLTTTIIQKNTHFI